MPGWMCNQAFVGVQMGWEGCKGRRKVARGVRQGNTRVGKTWWKGTLLKCKEVKCG